MGCVVSLVSKYSVCPEGRCPVKSKWRPWSRVGCRVSGEREGPLDWKNGVRQFRLKNWDSLGGWRR